MIFTWFLWHGGHGVKPTSPKEIDMWHTFIMAKDELGKKVCRLIRMCMIEHMNVVLLNVYNL
jgi:hypothetical protein